MKEMLENIDNWTLIKYISGLTITLSSIISFISYFIKDYFLNKWKSKYDIDLEVLRAKFSQNNSIIDNLTNSLSNVYLASNDKRIQYLEGVWEGMMNLKRNMPGIISMAYNILTKEEIENLPNTTNEFARASINSFDSMQYFESHSKLTAKLELSRPFIGNKLWEIFFTYQAFIGRLTYLIQDGLEKDKVKYWKDDLNFINQILKPIIKKEELEKLLEKDITAFNNVLNFLEFKALNDISEQLTGKKMTNESVEHAIRLSNLTKNTVA